jgi:trk system potassium uptake protein TrkA
MRVVIVGAGALGARAAQLLARRGYDVVVIEIDPEVARRLSESLDCGVIQGDGTRPAVLAEADPSHVDALLTLTSNAQTNLIAGLVGRSAGVPRVITRIDDEEFEHVTLELGLTDTIIPARTIGRYLADVVEGHDILELTSAIKGDARVFLFVARDEDEGTIAELGLPDDARVSHLYRDQDFLLADPELRLRKGDEVVIVCHRKHLEALRSRWAPSPASPLRGARH